MYCLTCSSMPLPLSKWSCVSDNGFLCVVLHGYSIQPLKSITPHIINVHFPFWFINYFEMNETQMLHFVPPCCVIKWGLVLMFVSIRYWVAFSASETNETLTKLGGPQETNTKDTTNHSPQKSPKTSLFRWRGGECPIRPTTDTPKEHNCGNAFKIADHGKVTEPHILQHC